MVLLTGDIIAGDLFRIYREKPALGTKVSIVCYVSDSLLAIQSISDAFDLLDSFNMIFSDYNPESEVMLLVANKEARAGVTVSKPLYDLTANALYINALTGGSFNITIGALTDLWRTYLGNEEIPPRCRIRKFRRHLQAEKLQLVGSSQIKLGSRGMRLDFGGIAKGYIGDHMAEVLKNQKINSFLIDLGGDLIAGAAPPQEKGWKISVSWCDKVVLLENQAIATSGPDFQFFVHKGKRYSHIIDPRTGWGVSHFFGSTVIAPSGWEADALASAFSILTLDESSKIIRRKTVINALIGRDNELFVSDNFSSYVLPENQTKE